MSKNYIVYQGTEEAKAFFHENLPQHLMRKYKGKIKILENNATHYVLINSDNKDKIILYYERDFDIAIKEITLIAMEKRKNKIKKIAWLGNSKIINYVNNLNKVHGKDFVVAFDFTNDSLI